jgi:hypothetical protein
MRTTLDIDDAILDAARAIAKDEGASIGAVISRLAQRGLSASSMGAVDTMGGFPAFAVEYDAKPITLDTVNEHRD